MAKKAPSVALRAQPRARIINRIAELNLRDFEAAEELGLSPGQMSRLRAREDVFTRMMRKVMTPNGSVHPTPASRRG